MKKLFALALLSAVCVTAFAGCKDDDTNLYTEASYDSVSEFVPDGVSREETENSNSLTGEFVVKEKKYVYKGNDLVVLNVENNTNKNYVVTITGTYLDAKGKVLKTETRTFDQFSAGYSNNFLFEPNMTFDKFEYKLETSEADGPFYADKLEYKYNGLREIPYYIPEQISKGDYTMYPSLLASFSYKYTGDADVQADIKWLLVNESGQIVYIAEKSRIINVGQGFDRYFDTVVLYTLEGDLVLPDEWKGDIQAIPILQSIAKNTQ